MTRPTTALLTAALLLSCGGETELEPTYPTSGCPPSHERVGGRCTVKEVLISGGQFLLGAGHCPHGRILEIPPEVHDCPLADGPRVVTVKPFWVDVAPQTGYELLLWHIDVGVKPPPGCESGDVACAGLLYEPVNYSFLGAVYEKSAAVAAIQKICAHHGKRWLTEVEWEYLATGGGTRMFPWGDRPPTCADANVDAERCGAKNADERQVSLVASYPPSPEGIYDLFGGFWEMLAPAPEAYDDAYTPLPLNLPEQCGGAWQCEWIPGAPVTAARGASRHTARQEMRSDYRYATYKRGDGFKVRCARDAE